MYRWEKTKFISLRSVSRDVRGGYISSIYIYITTPKNTTNVTIKQVDGHEWNRFVGRNLHECIYTPLDYTAFFVGWTSLVFWFCCQIPQFYKVKKNTFRRNALTRNTRNQYTEL